MFSSLVDNKVFFRKAIFTALAFIFVLFGALPTTMRAAVTEEQWITYLNTEIPRQQQIIDNMEAANVGQRKTIEDLQKQNHWWIIDDSIRNSIKEAENSITKNNSAIKRAKEIINSGEQQLQSVMLQNAKTPAEKKAAQARYDQIVKDRKANLVKMLNETKLEGAIDNASCFTVSGGINIGNCLMRTVGWTGNLVSWLFVLVLWLASKIFDVSVYMSITMVTTWFQADAVSSAWKLVRDFSNLFFVFILLYIAIGTIFDLKGISDPKKMITNVVIVALLVNFSGFFVRVVVDTSNIIAYEFYQSMGGAGMEFKTIGTELVKKLMLDKLYVTNATGDGNIDSSVIIEPKINRLSFLSIIGQTFGNIFIFLATAIVLLIAAFLFIIRTVVLLFIYIVSPFAFMSQIIPGTKFNYFKSWMNELVKQSFFAPAFLIPLYLVFMLLGKGGISDVGGTSGTSGWAIAGGGSGTLVVVNIIILGLIVSCIFIAQKVSEVGAEATPGFASKARQMLSRPLSRYGGRLANRVGAGIAGSSVGKAAAKSWNEGGLRLVRRSWDTGVLRTARESEYGKRAGQAIRNPLTSALGVQPFSVDERAKSILSDVKNLETDEQKSRFVEGLAGFRGKEEFDYIYNNMGNESVKVELAARKILADPNATAGAKKGAQMVADRMAQNRGKLSGKKAQDIAAEMVKSSKGGDKALALSSLSDGDLSAVYKKLTPAERIELEKDIAGDATLKLRVKTIKEALVGRDKEETKREESKQTRTAQSEAALAKVQQMFKDGQGASISDSDIRNIRPEHITDLDPGSLAYQNIATKLTTEQLQAIRGSASFQQSEKDAIREKIERAISSSTGTLPKELQRLKAYFEGNGSGF
ncbi:MAG: hypothetical protein WCV68_02920 [Candidatus Paceibacterota bacterium]|jgi:hypothetical protein